MVEKMFCFQCQETAMNKGCTKAVSYTHLDVYKRQALHINGDEIQIEIDKIDGLKNCLLYTSNLKTVL